MGMFDTIKNSDPRIRCTAGHVIPELQTKSMGCKLDWFIIEPGKMVRVFGNGEEGNGGVGPRPPYQPDPTGDFEWDDAIGWCQECGKMRMDIPLVEPAYFDFKLTFKNAVLVAVERDGVVMATGDSCWECGAKGGSHHRECRLLAVDALQRVMAWARERNVGRAPWNIPNPLSGLMEHPAMDHGPKVGCDACDAKRAAIEEMVPPHERVHQVVAVNIDMDGSVEAVTLENGSKVMGINQAAMHRNADTGECFLQVEFRCRDGVSVVAPDGSTLSINEALDQYGAKPEPPAPPAPVILDPRGRPVSSSTGSAKSVSADSRVKQLEGAIERLIASGNAMAEMEQYAVHADSGHQATKRVVRGCPPCEAINDWLVVLNEINERVAMPVSEKHPDISRGTRSHR